MTNDSLWDELRRRHVVRAAIGHAVFFWLLVQDENLDNLFRAEETLAAGVVAKLGAGDETVSVKTLSAKRCEMPSDSDALERYYTARHYVELRGDDNVDQLREGIALFEGLIAERPDFAEAMSGLAWAYWVQPTYDRDTS